jgi:hypothetical protein
MHYYLNAQKKMQFSSQNYIGLLTGASSTHLEVQTINGITKGKWFGGIGTGINWYYERTIPVFLFTERALQIKKNKGIYLSAGAGPNIPWAINYDKSGYLSRKMSAGFYWQTGAGYKINVGKQGDALLLYMGISNKTYKETILSDGIYCFTYPCPGNIETYRYKLHALSVKVGYSF